MNESAHLALDRARPERARMARVMGLVLTQRVIRNFVGMLLWVYQRLGVQFFLRRFRLLGNGNLARLESLVPSHRRKPASRVAVTRWV